MRRELWEGANLHCWSRKMWIRRVFGAGALLVTCCIAEGTQVRDYPSSCRTGLYVRLRQSDGRGHDRYSNR
jgi:hypothetical protein